MVIDGATDAMTCGRCGGSWFKCDCAHREHAQWQAIREVRRRRLRRSFADCATGCA